MGQLSNSKGSPAECFIITNIYSMESSAQIQSKKRNVGMLAAQELIGRFKSKQDFIVYFDQQYVHFIFSTHLHVACSSICRTNRS